MFPQSSTRFQVSPAPWAGAWTFFQSVTRQAAPANRCIRLTFKVVNRAPKLAGLFQCNDSVTLTRVPWQATIVMTMTVAGPSILVLELFFAIPAKLASLNQSLCK